MKRVLCGLIVAVLGACHKESPVDVTWSDGDQHVLLKKENVWLFGEKATVEYNIRKLGRSTELQANVNLEYPERVNAPRIINVVDYSNDFIADSVTTYNPYFKLSRNETPRARALHQANLVLVKLRKELNIDRVLKCGPTSCFDPFVQKQQSE